MTGLKNSLLSQGYKEVPAAQAGPGDVWISNSEGHTELVASKGGKTLIGANGDSFQRISVDNSSGQQGGHFYKKVA